MTNYQIINGDCLDVLRTMDAESVQCCVTSPPYFGLRDYGVDGQIGLEATPAEFVAKMVEVFEEVRRVLKKDGTLWLNLGDSYAGSWGAMSYAGGDIAGRRFGGDGEKIGRPHTSRLTGHLKAKDLIGIPWRVAFALQEAGWWLRQDIIWSKPNPMPESVTDRCTKAHEYMFLLTKSAKYFYNAEAIKQPVAESTIGRGPVDFGGAKGRQYKTDIAETDPKYRNGSEQWGRTFDYTESSANGANKRSVWTVTTQPYSEAHFATFPPKLIEPCILAGSREGDTVLDPFNGAGTTGLVSLRHRRNYIGIELNPEYIKIAEKRLKDVQVKLF